MEDLSLFTDSQFFDYEVFAKDVFDDKNNENIDDFLKSISLVEPEMTNESVDTPQESVDVIEKVLEQLADMIEERPELKEDKKRKNTAASARFRIKKKQKQQEMDQKITRLNEDIARFNNEIKKLEIENKILKELVFEKSQSQNVDVKDTLHNFLQNSRLDFQYTI